jgi:chromosomal replication initiation ATPase DnaA
LGFKITLNIFIMNNKETFLKQIEAYLNLEFNDFDRKRIVGYLDEYIDGLPEKKTPVATKIVYKYLSDIEQATKEHDVILSTPSEIINLITHKTGISINKLRGRHRYSETVLARHVAMYFINIKCHESLVKTGGIFKRDHTSVINAVRNVRNMIEGGNEKYIDLVNHVSQAISTPNKKTA